VSHATDTQHRHECGGTILCGAVTNGDLRGYDYCDKCGAYATHDASGKCEVPSGTDERANSEAWAYGDERSPRAARCVIRRVNSRHYQILNADGSRVLGFVSTLKQAERAAAMVDAETTRAVRP
jgi:hypothetical protein